MEIHPPQPPAPETTLAIRIGWLVLILATLYVCYFSHLGAIGFVGPDEPRYAWIARAMAETGDWVTPRLYGQPWFEKPPLYYWGAALSFKLFGVTEAAARLPSALSALLATLSLAWLALRLHGPETARWLLLLLPTTVGMIGFSHAAATDMPFSAMLTIAMVAAAALIRLIPDPGSPSGTSVAESSSNFSSSSLLQFAHSTLFISMLFGLFLGLAVLAKGPAGLVLCGGTVSLWALITKRWRDALRLFHPAAIACFCLTALPWYIFCAHRNPDFFRIFIIEHNFKRYLTPEFQHLQPFWYYLPILLIALFPWVGLSISAFTYVFRRKLGMQPDDTSIFLIAWIIFPLIFFSISRSKLPGYILPAVPPFVMLTAASLNRALRMPKVPVPAGFAAFALTPVITVAAVSVGVYGEHFNLVPHWFATVSAIIALTCAAACVICILRRQTELLIGVGVLCLILFVEAIDLSPLPIVDRYISPRRVSELVNAYPQSAGRIVVFRLKRSWQYGLNFYLHREIEEWNGDSNYPAIAVVSIEGLSELQYRHADFMVIDNTAMQAQVVQIGKANPEERK
jgi:4-amino-4-deoxy-L-arabinose transferase-like glycosyltransferase